jgi:D-3-phosphoglycerate dehydrogenase
MAPKVLISDKLSPSAVEIFKQRGIDVDQKVGLKPEELASIIGDYDGLAIRSATKVTKDILAKAKRLKVVGRAGIGTDNIDKEAATAHGVCVMNTPFGNSITTAEHAIAMMFALARQLPAANASTHAGKWEKSKFMGVELTGKVLGIIGCGNIGSIVADRAIGLKMRVIAHDPFLSVARAEEIGVEKVDMDAVFARADFITLHTPITDQTRGMINAANLAKCKKGVRLINCARGGLIVEADLVAALKSGQVAGAALDVLSVEPAKEHVLFGMENVVLTPHLGASTAEAQENVALQVAEQMSDFLLTGAVTNALNMPSVSAEDAPKLRPYLKLAEQLGNLAGQIVEGSVKAVTIEYEGRVAMLNTKPLSNTVLLGLLRPILESVNMVSAPAVARERNISFSEMRRERESDYHTLMRLKIETDNGSLELAGSLFTAQPRIVSIDGVTLEVELSPRMLFLRNEDRPGHIAKFTTILGDAKINIAGFYMGRTGKGKKNLSFLAVDEDVPAAVLEKIKAVPGVIKVHNLKFAG